MNIYLASRYSRFPEMAEYAATLRDLGHIVSSRWILGDHDLRAHGEAEADYYQSLWAAEDWEDLCTADTVISFTEPPGDVPGRSRGGRHCEHGIALALKKRCIVIGFRENVFHWLQTVEFYATWQACLIALQGETV
jgi:hypothetical protein